MIIFLKQTVRFILFLFAQALLFNQIELGWGIHPMIYPLFILLLPNNTNIFVSMLVAFALGIGIDSISNTYGLHTSAAVLIAYLRPIIFSIFEPRDGYEEGQEMNIYNVDFMWMIYVFGLMLVVHHLWFFTIELFKFNEIGFILRKTLLSVPVSMILCILIQIIFIKKPSDR